MKTRCAVFVAAVVAAIAFAGCSVSSAAEPKDSKSPGEALFDRHCLACHGPGKGFPPFAELPGTEALRVKYNGKMPALLTERTDLTPEFVAYFVRHGVSVMPFFRKTEISDDELAQLGAYLSKANSHVNGKGAAAK